MMVNTITLLRKRLDSINTHIEVLKRIENIARQQADNEDVKYIQSKQTDEKIFNYLFRSVDGINAGCMWFII